MEKVKLPKEVAEAIELLRAKGNTTGNIVRFGLNPKGESGFAIAKYLDDEVQNFDLFLLALVKGYEVEMTPEDNVKAFYDNYAKKDASIGIFTGPEVAYLIAQVVSMLGIKISGVNAE